MGTNETLDNTTNPAPESQQAESANLEQFLNWFEENKKTLIGEIKRDILEQISPLLYKLEEIIQQQQPAAEKPLFIPDGPFKKLQQDSKEKLNAMEKQAEVMEKQAEQVIAMEEQIMVKIEKANRRFMEMQTKVNKRKIK